MPSASSLGKVRFPLETIMSVEKAFKDRVGRETLVIRKGWRGYLGYEWAEHLLLGVQTLRKPPRRILALINTSDDSICFPTLSADDLRTACRAFWVTSDERLVGLYEFCNLEYGLTTKGEPATLLSSVKDLEEAGIAAADIEEASRKWRTLWWQRWGGKLYGADSSKAERAARGVEEPMRELQTTSRMDGEVSGCIWGSQDSGDLADGKVLATTALRVPYGGPRTQRRWRSVVSANRFCASLTETFSEGVAAAGQSRSGSSSTSHENVEANFEGNYWERLR